MVGQRAGRGAVVETVSSGISARRTQQWGRLRRSADISFADRALISVNIWWQIKDQVISGVLSMRKEKVHAKQGRRASESRIHS